MINYELLVRNRRSHQILYNSKNMGNKAVPLT